MEFINKSGNTIYLSDIDFNISFLEKEKIQFIDSDLAKKSKNFQFAVVKGLLFIVESSGEQIEKSLINNQGEFKKEEPQKENIISQNISDTLSVKIRGHFYEAGGYAKVNRNLALGLHKKGVDVYIDPMNINNIDLNEQEIKEISVLKKKAPNDIVVIDSIIPTYGQESFGKYRILYTTVEAESVPQQFVDSANLYHEIWVTSDFCKKVLEKYNIKPPIYVVTDSIDCELYKEGKEKYEFNPPLNKFIFVSVFGWSYRKGYDVLLKSYLKEFSGNDDVSLLVVSRFQYDSKYKNKIKDTIEEYINEYGGDSPAHIARCTRAIPENQMPELYRACNCFTLFTRGEGFCTLPDALIRKVEGVDKIKNIKIGDMVYSHKGNVKKVTKTFCNLYSGKMIDIYSYNRSNQFITLTPNHLVRAVRLSHLSSTTIGKFKKHMVYNAEKDEIEVNYKKHRNSKIHNVKLEWIKAEDIRKRDLLFFKVPKTNINIDKINIFDWVKNTDRYCFNKGSVFKTYANKSIKRKPVANRLLAFDHLEITEDLMLFLGYYVAEGCSSAKKGHIIFSFHSDENKYHNDVIQLGKKLFNLDFKKKKIKNKKVINAISYSVVLADVLLGLFGHTARNKSLPKWIFDLDDKMLSAFLRGLLRGDGCYGKEDKKNKANCQTIGLSTSSVQLAHDFFDILSIRGISSSIKKRIIKGKEYYAINCTSIVSHNKLINFINDGQSFDMGRNYKHSIIIDGYQFVSVRKINERVYDGNIYNLEVEEDNSYICENIAVHNCVPYCESSLCGLPIIGTRCSAQTMFLNDDNSYLLDVDEMIPMQPGLMHVHYWDNQIFPALTSEKVIKDGGKLMRHVYENYPEAKEKNKKLSNFIKENYNINSTCDRVIERLENIRKKIC